MSDVEEEAARLLALPDITKSERNLIVGWRDGRRRTMFFRGVVYHYDEPVPEANFDAPLTHGLAWHLKRWR